MAAECVTLMCSLTLCFPRRVHRGREEGTKRERERGERVLDKEQNFRKGSCVQVHHRPSRSKGGKSLLFERGWWMSGPFKSLWPLSLSLSSFLPRFASLFFADYLIRARLGGNRNLTDRRRYKDPDWGQREKNRSDLLAKFDLLRTSFSLRVE